MSKPMRYLVALCALVSPAHAWEFNARAAAILDGVSPEFPLDGVAEEFAEFRACLVVLVA